MNEQWNPRIQACERCGTYTNPGLACACWPTPPTLTGGRGMDEQDWATWLAVLGYLQSRYGTARMVTVLRLEAARLEIAHDQERVRDQEQARKSCAHTSRARIGHVEDGRWACNDCGYDNDKDADAPGTSSHTPAGGPSPGGRTAPGGDSGQPGDTGTPGTPGGVGGGADSGVAAGEVNRGRVRGG